MINIAIIMMTLTKNTTYKHMFNKSFDKNVKLHFIHWTRKNILNYIKKNKIDGIILTGSAYRILHNKNADLPKKILEINIPILGICYGYQWIIKNTCGKSSLSSFPKNNRRLIKRKINKPFTLPKMTYLLNHHDYITSVPKNWNKVIKNGNQILMAYNKSKKIIGIQFHPEAVKKTRKIFFKKWIKYITK